MPGPRRLLSLEEVLELLATGPQRIAGATAGAPAAALREPLEPGGWSGGEILAHLRACEWTLGGYVVRILDEDHPTFRYESPRSTIRRTDFLTRSFAESLERLTADRIDLLTHIRAAGGELTTRAATVKLASRGEVQRTAFDYAHQLAEHEHQHVEHLERVMAARRGS